MRNIYFFNEVIASYRILPESLSHSRSLEKAFLFAKGSYTIRRFFADIEFPWKANFYKCGDETLHPHFGCWNPVVAEEPNFHLPEFFGTLLCKEEVKN